MVDTYLTTFYKNKGFLTSNHKLMEDIVENPHAYHIYEGMSLLTNISRYDLPDAEVYRDFFRLGLLFNLLLLFYLSLPKKLAPLKGLEKL